MKNKSKIHNLLETDQNRKQIGILHFSLRRVTAPLATVGVCWHYFDTVRNWTQVPLPFPQPCVALWRVPWPRAPVGPNFPLISLGKAFLAPSNFSHPLTLPQGGVRCVGLVLPMVPPPQPALLPDWGGGTDLDRAPDWGAPSPYSTAGGSLWHAPVLVQCRFMAFTWVKLLHNLKGREVKAKSKQRLCLNTSHWCVWRNFHLLYQTFEKCFPQLNVYLHYSVRYYLPQNEYTACHLYWGKSQTIVSKIPLALSWDAWSETCWRNQEWDLSTWRET